MVLGLGISASLNAKIPDWKPGVFRMWFHNIYG
jgi:hypothetical protein